MVHLSAIELPNKRCHVRCKSRVSVNDDVHFAIILSNPDEHFCDPTESLRCR